MLLSLPCYGTRYCLPCCRAVTETSDFLVKGSTHALQSWFRGSHAPERYANMENGMENGVFTCTLQGGVSNPACDSNVARRPSRKARTHAARSEKQRSMHAITQHRQTQITTHVYGKNRLCLRTLRQCLIRKLLTISVKNNFPNFKEVFFFVFFWYLPDVMGFSGGLTSTESRAGRTSRCIATGMLDPGGAFPA